MNDLSPEIYGRLTVIREAERRGGRRFVVCKCVCGTEKTVMLNNLRQGNVKSCGCLRHEGINKIHGGKGTRLYRIWTGIKTRCFNPNAREYREYGGRGIIICNAWLNFGMFREWALTSGYSDDLTIERINVDGNYEPENCTWITLGDQAKNRTNTPWISYLGERKTLKEWSYILGIEYHTLFARLRYRGWPISKAFTTPSKINRTKAKVI